MKTLGIILLVLAIIGYFGYLELKKAWEKVSFNVYFKSADLSQINLTSLATALASGGQVVNVVIGADVKNDNNYSLVFSGLKVMLSYNGVTIAHTSGDLANKRFVVPANTTLQVQDNATVILNAAGISLLSDKISAKSPVIDHSVSIKVYGIRLPLIKGQFAWWYKLKIKKHGINILSK